MTQKYLVLLKAIVVGASNKTIRVIENAVTVDVTLTEGTYFLRGDATSDDLGEVYRAAVQSHTGANTYTHALALSTDPAAIAGTSTLTRATGANNFQLSWSHASTTFDPALLGFSEDDTANDGTAKVGSLSPSALWVAPETHEFFEPQYGYDASVNRSRSGRVRTLRRGGPYNERGLSFILVDDRRVWDWGNVTDPAACFNRFMASTVGGAHFEVHSVAVSSGTTLGALSTSTRIGTAWHWHGDSVDGFEPERHDIALSLYNWDMRLMGYVA